MGLFDSLRSKRAKDGDREADGEAAAQSEAPADIDWFKPRTDGIYRGEGTEVVPYLRFTVTGRAQETWTDKDAVAAREVLAATSDDRAEGEYSRGGLMSVVRRFERPIVYAVRDTGFVAGDHGLFESFTARCTNTNTRETTAIAFTFYPDEA